MAVRASVFHAGFRYNEYIGPAEGRYIPGSESAFNMMLQRHGYRFYFSNSVVVQHQIRPEQLTKKWLKRRAYIFGKGRVIWEQISAEGTQVRKIGIFPRWYAKSLMKSHIDYVTSWFSGDKATRTRAVWNAMIVYGMIMQTLRIHRHTDALQVILYQMAG
jgi:hypothetical protein